MSEANVITDRQRVLLALMQQSNALVAAAMMPFKIVRIAVENDARLLDIVVLYEDDETGWAFVPVQYANPITVASAVISLFLVTRAGSIVLVSDDDNSIIADTTVNTWVSEPGYQDFDPDDDEPKPTSAGVRIVN